MTFLEIPLKPKTLDQIDTPVREVNGEEGERVVVGLRLLANDPGQAESRSLCSDTGENSPPQKYFNLDDQLMLQEQASDPTLRLKPKERKASVDVPSR